MALDSSEHVGVVGSPSTTNEVTLDLVGEAARKPLAGSMVVFEQSMDGRTEYALGTVTEITTTNQWHENIAMRGVIAMSGRLTGLSGRADVKAARVGVQAVYVQHNGKYVSAGAALSMSPETGTAVYRVNDKVLEELTRAEAESLFYLGDIYRMPGTRLPLNPSDFAGPRGAFHAGVFGPSGAGKSVFTCYYIAGQLRHHDLGVFIVDPQGQFTVERPGEFRFSLQRLAKLLGRTVLVKSLANEIRLQQDRGLFCELLAKTGFFRLGLAMRYQAAIEMAVATVYDTLDKAKGWSDLTPPELLSTILQGLHKAAGDGVIYKDLKRDKDGEVKPEGSAYQLLRMLDQALHHNDPRERLERYLRPIASLFGEPTPDGKGRRMKMERLLHLAFERNGGPRPLIILDLSITTPGDEEQLDTLKVLNSEATKARILRALFEQMERIAAADYRAGERLLNTLVVFDEAWRFAPRSSREPEIAALAEQLAGYARETRKYGVGWMYVLQSPHSLHPDVWDQLKSGFRALGFGLTGADLELVRAQVDRPESIALYRSFTQPTLTNPQYPFMLVGAISPLSVTTAPLYATVYNTFDQWCEANAAWLPANAITAKLNDPSSRAATSAFSTTQTAIDISTPSDDLFM